MPVIIEMSAKLIIWFSVTEKQHVQIYIKMTKHVFLLYENTTDFGPIQQILIHFLGINDLTRTTGTFQWLFYWTPPSNITLLPVHGLSKHIRLSMGGPLQLWPPNSGLGFAQIRNLVWWPTLHVPWDEQKFQGDQCVHMPCTGAENKKQYVHIWCPVMIV